MRRRTLPLAALLTTLFLAACADSGPTTSGLQTRITTATNLSLEDYIQEQIDLLLPRGFEDAVNARWSTVKDKFRAGDFDGAAKHLNTLAMWIDKKTGEITPPAGETQGQAAVRLILNMTTWLYGDQNADPLEELPGDDVTVEVVPAGTAAEVTTPSDHAGVAFGPQEQDRIIIISQELFPGKCNGPLPTERCQYPLFYHISSFPNEKLVGGGRFAICLVTDPTDPRRPLDYPGQSEVHNRLRLAHNAPANPTTPGAYVEEDDIPGAIEVLPRVPEGEQTGFVTCDEHSDVALKGPEKWLHSAVHFAERVFRPSNAYAYDRGPEHRSDDFSFFNAIDPVSQADLAVHSLSAPSSAFTNAMISVSYTVDNISRHFGGAATAASRATEAVTYLSSDATLDANDVEKARVPIAGMAPDATPQSILQTVTLPSTPGTYYLFVQVEESPGFGEVTLANNTTAAHAITVTSESRENIAIYKNYNAWFGENKDEVVLQGAPFSFVAGTDYVVRPMSGLAAGIPSETDLIIITSAGNGNLNNQITEQNAGLANLDAWVRAGGWLVIHAGDNAPSGQGYLVPGLSARADKVLNCAGLTLSVANHALIRGPDAALGTADDLTNSNIDINPRTGTCYDNHGSLAGILPENAEVLMTEETGSFRPVYATYTLGSGRVIVTTLTLEFGPHFTQTLVNHFYWAIYGLDAPATVAAKIARSTGDPEPSTVNSDGTPRNP